ncbi:pyridoxamine 5'-phosphate oxidase [Microtetraspora sp. NBRC 13810]|uniref:pyridoxamine 5'-phosphate oxidase family protein n=1 Tax=Microtetraspora sp. NBRC 13810 TaxID=3030990 RepID=UPI0024A119CD|nr:pyridoxamine 5'-phosphate oxidase family protein [Microtetraspora sp. NBRC 13810]GLW06919.1 pyridoxamine 5'-phosphate oxidase [Microtetraspora sp. NBRC 13810]
MASWQEFERAVPEFAARARALLDAHRHKTMATLRKDGSPRISGTELDFRQGEVWLGSMAGAVKALDLRRDPRVAVHSASPDPGPDGAWAGDAKFSGLAVEITDKEALAEFALPGKGSHLFRIDVAEVVLTSVDPAGELLEIEIWQEGRGLRKAVRQ